MPHKAKTHPVTFKTSPVSVALRDAGFVPLPRLWVRKDAMKDVHKITEKFAKEVNDIRSQVHLDHPELGDQRPVFHKGRLAEEAADAEEDLVAKALSDKEAAWAAFEQMRR